MPWTGKQIIHLDIRENMGKVDVFGLFRVGICSPTRCFLAGVITNCIGLYHHFDAFAKLVIKVSFM